ncbi:MAG: hypothetical protein DRO88_06845 [Promethearchaeia archaeon]|nr:MAG: hypothetical protein DRO88_06845 [Candidatus Lokiarchaeia archaeon]
MREFTLDITSDKRSYLPQFCGKIPLSFMFCKQSGKIECFMGFQLIFTKNLIEIGYNLEYNQNFTFKLDRERIINHHS